MNAFNNSLSLGLLTTLAAISIPVASAEAQVTIVRINGGGSPPAANSTGTGNLTTIFNAACDWWEAALVTSPYTLTLTYRWGTQSGGTLAAHTLNAQGGTPHRETAGTIVFDNDGSTDWFLDPTPCNPSEYTNYNEGTGNYGAGSMNDEMGWTGATGAALNQFDLFRTALHEVGHALGLSSANTAFQAERGDNDVDIAAPLPFAGSAIPLQSSSAHVSVTSMLMCGGCATRNLRRFPSMADMLANAQISQMDGVSWVSHDGCSRYISGSSGSTGSNNVIPFGTSSPSSLVTTYANNNGLSAPGNTVYFDVDVGSGSHVYLHGVAVHTDVANGTPIQADIYRRSGTYVGATGSSSGWTLWTTAKGTSASTGNESRLNFNSGIYLASGSTNGIAIVARDYDTNYTNGANTYSNSAITITTGASASARFNGSPISPRTANIRLYYQRDSATWHNQKYQTVLRCQELGGPGMITGLAFNSDGTSVHYNRLLRIRMTHKPSGYNLSTNFATNISGYTQVLNELDHSWEINTNGWNEIGLQSGFNYNGTGDVVVEIMARGNHTSTGTVAAFHRDPDAHTPRAFAYGWPWSSEPTTTTSSSAAGGGIDNFGTKVRVEFECANVGDFGTSCSRAFADAVSTPVAGTSYTFHIHSGPPSSGAIIILGFSVPGTPLSSQGFDGCYAWVDNVASTFKLTSSSGFASHVVTVPNSTAYDGLKIYGYWAAIDSNAPGGLAFTNYVRSIIGQSNP